MSKIVPQLLSSDSVFSKDASYYIHKSMIGDAYPLHRHEFFEIDLLLTGKATSQINDCTYELSVGDIIFLSPADHHSYLLKEDADDVLSVLNIAFPINLIYSGSLAHIPFDSSISHLNDAEFLSAKYICDIALEHYENKAPHCDLFIKTCIEWLFLCIEQHMLTESHGDERNNIDFAPALAYIHANFADVNLRRDSVAKIMNMSPTHFSKCFHRIVGISFQNYLLNLRLNYANGVLKTTNLSVSQVALSSGFSSDCYFSKMYKQRFGMAPGKAKRPG